LEVQVQQLVTAEEMARILGVAAPTLRDWVTQRKIPAGVIRIGSRTLRFDPVEVVAALKSAAS
jgi:excisionase family DNA binding protein